MKIFDECALDIRTSLANLASSPLIFTVTPDSYKLRCLLIAAVFYDSLRRVRRVGAAFYGALQVNIRLELLMPYFVATCTYHIGFIKITTYYWIYKNA